MRLIDADALIKTLGIGDLPIRLTYEIYNAPTVDAVEVIRCKDCKHYADDQCDRYADETLGYEHSTQAYGYCWLAERKEE